MPELASGRAFDLHTFYQSPDDRMQELRATKGKKTRLNL
jgi:hypothetical protein